MIQKVDLLSQEECVQVRDTIHLLRPHWIHRAGDYPEPFYSLGIGTYLDGKVDVKKNYYDLAPQHNDTLRLNFGWLYERLIQVMEKELGRHVIYDDDLALPGFHIFLASKTFEKPLAPIHWDLQHHYLNWDGKDVVFEDLLSFTAAIQLPKWGGGLNVWELTLQQMEKLSPQECETYFANGPQKYVEYETGKMVLHAGEITHQIAPMKNVTETCERITLQGHGIPSKNGYILYW